MIFVMIGILTFIGTQSHGACLQAYALMRTISELGFDVEVISYLNPKMNKERKERLPHIGQSPKHFLGNIKRFPSINKRYNGFLDFEQKYLGVKQYIEAINWDKYDLIIVGSDQVWNLGLTGNDLTYMLSGIERYKKGTYAASMGVSKFPTDKEMECIHLINDFPFLNVREKQLKEYLEEKMPEKDIKTVLDPTLLVKKKQWTELFGDNNDNKRYMLVHYPFESEENWNYIRNIAKIGDWDIVYLTNSIKRKSGCKCLYAVTPIEYLKLIYNAKVIVTGSFHTLSFSLIFNKQFYCTQSKIADRNSRLENLLDMVGCGKQMLNNFPNAITYPEVNSVIEKKRTESLTLLREMCLTSIF